MKNPDKNLVKIEQSPEEKAALLEKLIPALLSRLLDCLSRGDDDSVKKIIPILANSTGELIFDKISACTYAIKFFLEQNNLEQAVVATNYILDNNGTSQALQQNKNLSQSIITINSLANNPNVNKALQSIKRVKEIVNTSHKFIGVIQKACAMELARIPLSLMEIMGYYLLSYRFSERIEYIEMVEKILNFSNRTLLIPNSSQSTTYGAFIPAFQTSIDVTVEKFMSICDYDSDAHTSSLQLIKSVCNFTIQSVNENSYENCIILAKAYKRLATVHFKVVDYKSCIEACKIAIQLINKAKSKDNKDKAEAQSLLFLIYVAYGNVLTMQTLFIEAAEKYELAFKIKPNDTGNLLNMMHCYNVLEEREIRKSIFNEINNPNLRELFVDFYIKKFSQINLSEGDINIFRKWEEKNSQLIKSDINVERFVSRINCVLSIIQNKPDLNQDTTNDTTKDNISFDEDNILNLKLVLDCSIEQVIQMVDRKKNYLKDRYYKSPFLLNVESLMHIKLENFHDAAKSLKQAISLFSNEDNSSVLLEVHFKLTEYHPSLGLELALYMKEQIPQSPITDYCLAWAYYHNSKFEVAKELINNSYKNLEKLCNAEVFKVAGLIVQISLRIYDDHLVQELRKHLPRRFAQGSDITSMINLFEQKYQDLKIKIEAEPKKQHQHQEISNETSETSEEDIDEILFTPRKLEVENSTREKSLEIKEEEPIVTILEESDITISNAKKASATEIYFEEKYFAKCHSFKDYEKKWEGILKKYGENILDNIKFSPLSILVHNFAKSPMPLKLKCWPKIKDCLLSRKFEDNEMGFIPLAQMTRVFSKLSNLDYEYEEVLDKLSELTLKSTRQANPFSVSIIADSLSKAREPEKYIKTFKRIKRYVFKNMEQFSFGQLIEILHAFRKTWHWPNFNVAELYLEIAPTLEWHLNDRFKAGLDNCITPYNALDLYKLTTSYIPAMQNQDVKEALKPLVLELYTLFQKISSQINYTKFITPAFYNKSKDLDYVINDDEIVTEYVRNNIKVEPSEFNVIKVLESLKGHKKKLRTGGSSYEIPIMDFNGNLIRTDKVYSLTMDLTKGQVEQVIFIIDPAKVTPFILNIIRWVNGIPYRIETIGGPPNKEGKFYGIPLHNTIFNSSYSHFRSTLLPEEKAYYYGNKMDGYVDPKHVLKGKINIGIDILDFRPVVKNEYGEEEELHIMGYDGWGFIREDQLPPGFIKELKNAKAFGKKDNVREEKIATISYPGLLMLPNSEELVNELTSGFQEKWDEAISNGNGKNQYRAITTGMPKGSLYMFAPSDDENIYLPNTFKEPKGGAIVCRSPYIDAGNLRAKPEENVKRGSDPTSKFISNMPIIKGGMLVYDSENDRTMWIKFVWGVIPKKNWPTTKLEYGAIVNGVDIKSPKFQYKAGTCLVGALVFIVVTHLYKCGAVALPKDELISLHADCDGDHGPVFSEAQYPVFCNTVASTQPMFSVEKPEKKYVSAIREDGQYRHSRAYNLLSTLMGNTLQKASNLLATYKRLSEEKKEEVATECLALIKKRAGNGTTPHQTFYNDILQEAITNAKGDTALSLEYIIVKAIYIATDAPKATTDILKIGELCEAIKQYFEKRRVTTKLPYSKLRQVLKEGNGLTMEQLESFLPLFDGANSLADSVTVQNLMTLSRNL